MKKYGLINLIILILIFGAARTLSAREDLLNKKRSLHIGIENCIFSCLTTQEIKEKFIEAHPGTEIILDNISGAEARQALKKAKLGIPTHDLIIMSTGINLGGIVTQSSLSGWKDIFVKIPENRFVRQFLDSGKYRGKIYSLPLSGYARVLLLRPDMFMQRGLKGNKYVRPETWDMVKRYAKTLTLDIDSNGSTDVYGMAVSLKRPFLFYNIWAHVISRKGAYIDKNGNYDLKSSQFREAVLFYKELLEQKVLLPEALNKQRIYDGFFIQNRAAMYFYRQDSIENASIENISNQEFQIDIHLLPGAEENGTLVFQSAGVLLPKTGNEKLAREFTREILLSRWFQVKMANEYGWMPVIEEYYRDLKEPYWNELLQCVKVSPVIPAFERNSQMVDVICLEFGKAIAGLKPVDKAINDAYEQVKTLKEGK